MQGKVAIVTGSRQGIGKAIAWSLAEQGAFVVLNARDAAKLEATEKEFKEKGFNVLAIAADISDYTECERLVKETIEKFGRLDILVNNAGTATRGAVDSVAPMVFQQVVNTNILGCIFPSKAALHHLRQSKGSVVFISSIAGFTGLPFNAIYCTSKKALTAFADAFRIEERPHGVHVGIVYVGFTENDPQKIVYDSDGKLIYLAERKGIKKQSTETVAKKVVGLIKRRSGQVTLSVPGKFLSYLSRWTPWLVRFMYRKNYNKIKANSEGEPNYVQKES